MPEVNETPLLQPPTPELGKVLASHGFSRKEAWAFVVIGLIMVGFAPVGYAMVRRNSNDTLGYVFTWMPPMFGLLIVGMGVFKLSLARYAFRIAERGIRREGIDGSRTDLGYEDVETVLYEGREVHRQGMVETIEKLALQTTSGVEFNLWSRRSRVIGDELTPVRIALNLAAASMAGKLETRVREGREVEWTGGLTIGDEGVRDTGGQVIRWKDLDMRLADGTLELRSAGTGRTVQNLRVKERNFFPGYLLATRLQGATPKLQGAATRREG